MAAESDASFGVLADADPANKRLPAFMVSTSRGFLPRADPVVNLPGEFSTLESLLSRMPIQTASGEAGLLARGTLGDTVIKELPDLSDAIEIYADDLPVINALYRDYSFLASAYLLEPCHLSYLDGKGYGLARDVLPACIARPIARVAKLAGFKPFMEYAGSYALYNYRLVDPALGLEFSNLRLIRAFERGHDPASSEAGFVLVHVAMVSHSGPLVSAALSVLDALSSVTPECVRRAHFDAGLDGLCESMRKINGTMEEMWSKSHPADYQSFRTFIFGIQSQSMFPHGVIYEGVSTTPFALRGETGANDSMIPLMDSILQISMPDTPLTDILKDFRSYRPGNHRDFLSYVTETAARFGVKDYALQSQSSRLRYLSALDQVREFRWRHWCFTREYILKHSKHPRATGGSPIITWLPNQLGAVLDAMTTVGGLCGWKPETEARQTEARVDVDDLKGVSLDEMMDKVQRQQRNLAKEVNKWCQERAIGPDEA